MIVKTVRMTEGNFEKLCETLLAMGVLWQRADTPTVTEALVKTDKGLVSLSYNVANRKLYIEKGE